MPSNHKMHIFFLYCLMGSKRIENVCFGFSRGLPFGNSYECGTCSEQVCKMLSFFLMADPTGICPPLLSWLPFSTPHADTRLSSSSALCGKQEMWWHFPWWAHGPALWCAFPQPSVSCVCVLCPELGGFRYRKRNSIFLQGVVCVQDIVFLPLNHAALKRHYTGLKRKDSTGPA